MEALSPITSPTTTRLNEARRGRAPGSFGIRWSFGGRPHRDGHGTRWAADVRARVHAMQTVVWTPRLFLTACALAVGVVAQASPEGGASDATVSDATVPDESGTQDSATQDDAAT